MMPRLPPPRHQVLRRLSCLFAVLLIGFHMSSASAQSSTLELLKTQLHLDLTPVGHGVYRKFGFRVYEATLYAPSGRWDAGKPFALELHYMRGVSKDTMVDTVTSDIRDQNVADDDTFFRWQADLKTLLPAVEDGDDMVGISDPGKPSRLFFNGKELARLSDAKLSTAFFNIWLGSGADSDLKSALLGTTGN